jgi:hypothetical protein
MGYGTWGGTFEGQRSGEVDRVAVQDVACHNGHCTVLARWTRVKGAVRMMTVDTGLEVGHPQPGTTGLRRGIVIGRKSVPI